MSKVKRKTYKYLLFLLFITTLDAPNYEDRSKQIEDYLIFHLQTKGRKIKEKWSLYYIQRTAYQLAESERILGISVDKLMALIEYESEWEYWINVNNIRYGKTISTDIGLTQQNSRYVQQRCKREFRRKCKRWELWLPWVSIRLMNQRFFECADFEGSELIFLCYNSNQYSMDCRRKNKKCKDDYLKVWRVHLKKFTGI